MSYMIEGKGSKTQAKAKKWLYQHPEASQRLLQMITSLNVDYLVGQVKAGAQMLQVFESHGEFLTQELFDKFSLPYLTTIVEQVKAKLKTEGIPEVPMVRKAYNRENGSSKLIIYYAIFQTVFAKGAHFALEQLAKTGYDVIGLDWTMNPESSRARVGDNVTLQGNFDPCALYAPKVNKI